MSIARFLAFAIAIASCALANAADLLVASTGTHSQNGILRYDGSTGAFVGRFIDINRPFAMTYGPDGNLYVGSQTSQINRYNGTTGAFLNTLVSSGSGGLGVPWDMTFGADGNLYVATTDGSSEGVLRYNGTTGAFMDRFVTAPSVGLTFGSDGNLYVSSGDTVKRYSGGDGSFLGDFVAANSSTIRSPYHLDFGPDGHLYVVNVIPGVRKYDGTNGEFMGDFAVPPNPNFGSFLAFEFEFGPDGHLYMNNGQGSGVMRFNGTTGAFMDQFVAVGSGGMELGRSMVFMVPEPGITCSGLPAAIFLCRRRRILTAI